MVINEIVESTYGNDWGKSKDIANPIKLPYE
jgi:hypothetical protein